VFKITPSATDLHRVGPAQQPTKVNEKVLKSKQKVAEHKEWYKRILKGTMKILEGPRRHVISQTSREDLLRCLDLMSCKETLEFDWNVDMYISPQPLRQPRVHSSETGHLEGDDEVKEETDDEDDDAALPTWTRGEVHLIGTEAPPWWALARFFCFGFFFVLPA
jgi:hypothetical protein